MTPTLRNRLLLVTALLIAGSGVALVAWGNLGHNLVYYWTPGEMLAQGDKAHHATIRLGGIVGKGSVDWSPQKNQLRFRVMDGLAPDAKGVSVEAAETPPAMFREGIGVVVEGTLRPDGVFQSDRLMVKHSNEYRAPKGGSPEDWKKSVMETETAEKGKP
jgi:cytochrome c-type biogenesis protein CcmE